MMNSRRNWLVRLRPRADTLLTSQGRTVLATATTGFIPARSYYGLFSNETRLLSSYACLIDGQEPLPIALSNVEQHSWLGYYIVLPPGFRSARPDQGSGEVPQASQNSLELRLSRYVGQGVHEDVDLTNFTQQHTSFQLEFRLDADFASIEEIRSVEGTEQPRLQHGKKNVVWRPDNAGAPELQFTYTASHHFDNESEHGQAEFSCGLRVRLAQSDTSADYREGAIIFPVELAPAQSWHACLQFIPVFEGRSFEPVYSCRSFCCGANTYEKRRRIFVGEATRFVTQETGTLTAVVANSLEQAMQDLAALRLHDVDEGERAWTVVAGFPTYVALFGRDALTVAWQSALVSTSPLQGTLAEIARWQGTQCNDWRDEQPGRMLHEAHTSPLAMLNFNPRRRYYGAITTSAFYGVALSLLWHWTADKDRVAPLLDPALKALQWLDGYSRGKDGFYYYQSRSSNGTKNQGWKDSGDAIVYPDGTQVSPPIATCEAQGFVHAAKLQLAEVLWSLDRKEEASKLFHQAGELKRRFNEKFWMEDAGYFAMGLDSEGRQIGSIGSGPGHCIATGIVEQELVERTAARMFADDLFTGWGIRTLSSGHPAYNPYSYHRGSVWPVEHGTFAMAFMRYGLHSFVEKICRAQFEAAGLFEFDRLPELFSGHQRDSDHPFPAFYPAANWPQAWSASTMFSLLQSMLGLYPYAPLHALVLDPHLPEWLPEITLENLHVGDAILKLRFFREPDGSSDYEVLEKKGRMHVLRQPSPWSLTAGYPERIKDAFTSLLPGR
jgi:glycogen debranching enzyme